MPCTTKTNCGDGKGRVLEHAHPKHLNHRRELNPGPSLHRIDAGRIATSQVHCGTRPVYIYNIYHLFSFNLQPFQSSLFTIKTSYKKGFMRKALHKQPNTSLVCSCSPTLQVMKKYRHGNDFAHCFRQKTNNQTQTRKG